MPPPIPEANNGSGRGRGVHPRRVRHRRLIRVALIVIASGLVLVLAVGLALHTPPARRYVLTQVREILASRGIDLQAAALHYNLPALSVSLDDVVLRSRERSDAAPFARVRHADLNLSVTNLLFGRYVLQDGHIVSPDLHLFVDDQGRTNLPSFTSSTQESPKQTSPGNEAGGGDDLVDYLIERFSISNARLRYEDRRQQLDAVLPVSSLTIEGDRATRHHQITLAAGHGAVTLQRRTMAIDRVRGEVGLDREKVLVKQFDLGVGDSTLSLAGNVIDLNDPQCDLTLKAQLPIPGLATFAGLTEPVSGTLHANIIARGPLATPNVQANLQGRDLSFRALKDVQLAADATHDVGTRLARVVSLHVTAPVGRLAANGLVALDARAGASELHVDVDALDISRVTSALAAPYHIASVVDATLSARWPGLEYARAAGDARLTFTPTATEPSPKTVPLAGTVIISARAAARGERVTVDLQRLRALGATVDGSLSLAQQRALGGTIHARVEDLAHVIPAAEAFLGRRAGSLVGVPVAGPLSIDANVRGTRTEPAIDAVIDAPRLALSTTSDIIVHAEAAYTPAAVTLKRGEINWQAARVHANGRMGLEGRQPVDLDVTAEEISIAEALAAAGQRDVHAGGSVSFRAGVRGTVSKPRAELTLHGRDLHAYGEALGTLAMAAAFTSPRAELTQLRLDKPQPGGNGTLTARGAYDLESAHYDFDMNSEDLRLATLALPDGRPVRAALTVDASGQGTLKDPTGTAAIKIADLHVGEDRFGDLTVNAEAANQQARVRATVPTFNLSADAQMGTSAPYPTRAEVVLSDLDLALLPLHLDTPLTGRVRARLTGAAELTEPANGTATAAIDRLAMTWNGQPIETDGPAAVRYAQQRLLIDRLSVRARDSVLSVRGEFPLDPQGVEGAIDLNATANLATLAAYAPADLGVIAEGELALNGTVRGSMRRIDPTLTLTVANGSVSAKALPQPVSDIGIRLDVADGALAIPDVHANWGAARLTASGHVPFGWLPADLPVEVPRQTGAAGLQAAVSELDVSTLPGVPKELTGRISLRVDSEAPRPDITSLTGRLTFPDLQVAFNGLTLAQQGSSAIALDGGEVRVEQFALDGTAGHVDLSGSVGLTDQQPLAAQARANLDMAALSTFVEDLRASGRASLEVSASGTVPAPVVKGFVELADGRFAIDEPQIAADGLNLRIDATPERITLARLDGNVNGGTLSGSGSTGLQGTTLRDLNLHVKASDVALDTPLNLRSVSNADIQITQRAATPTSVPAPSATSVVQTQPGTDPAEPAIVDRAVSKAAAAPDEIVVGGQVTIEEAGLTDDINLDAGIFQTLTAPRSLDLTETRNPLLERIRFDLKVHTAAPVIVDNNLARAELDADLRLLGTPYETGLSGRLELAEGSELILNERRYQVQRGIVTFTDERRIQPLLDLVLETTARKYDIEIEAAGTPDDTETGFTSTPSLPEPDILALLVTGRTLDEMRGEEFDLAKTQALSLLGGRLGSSIGRGLQRATGLSQVRVEPNLIANETDPGARLTVGQDLTSDVSLVYSTDLVNSSDNVWIAEYDVSRQFNTRAVRQSDDSYRFDFQHDVHLGGTPEPGRSSRPRQTVRSLTITGQPMISEEEIRRRFKLEPGDRYTFFRARDGAARLSELYHEQDWLQARLRVRKVEDNDEVDLTLDITPGPKVTLAFQGYSPSDSLLKEARTIWSRGVFDTQRADDVVEALRARLIDERYLEPKIEYDLGQTNQPVRRVTFRVDSGVRYEKITLAFDGARGIEADELSDVIDEQELGQQVFTDPSAVTSLLTRLYRERGYLAAEVADPRYELDSGGRVARVVIPVQEGPQFKIRSVTMAGNRVYPTEALVKAIPTLRGDPYFPATAELSATRIRQLYWAKGYNEVRPVYELATDRNAGVLDVRFNITEGRRSIVAAIGVQGNKETSQGIITQELELQPGKPLDLSALGRSRKNLYDTGAFSLVDITRQSEDPQPPHPTPAADAGAQGHTSAAGTGAPSEPASDPVRVNVAVREVQPFQISYGATFDTERGPGGIFDISNHNSLGRARVVGLRTRYDSQVRDARIYLSQPSLHALPVETIGSVYYRAERNPATSQADAFNVDRMGVMLQQEKRLRNQYIWSYGYRFERARTYELGTEPLPPSSTSPR